METDIVGAIYDCVDAQQPWQSMARRIRSHFNATGALFKFSPVADDGDGARFIYDATPALCENWPAYNNVYRHLDPTCHRAMRSDTVYDLPTLLSPRPDRCHAEYMAFCQSIGAANALFAYLGENRGMRMWLSISRDEKQGAFDDGEMRGLIDLMPHLYRTASIQLMRDTERCVARTFADALADLGTASFVLAADGQILGTNRLADALLTEGGPCYEFKGRLHIGGKVQRRFGDILRKGLKGNLLLEEEVAGQPFFILVTPRDGAMDGIGSDPAYMVHIESSASLPTLDIGALRRRFRLSWTEARLTHYLAHGMTLAEAAVEMGVTAATIRTYCKRALGRMGLARQADLVRAVHSNLIRLDQKRPP